MDYRAAARFRATKLSDLIAEEMLAGNRGLFEASKKAISAKARARITGVKQKFDPLNIASAILGRSRLGTTLVGKMFGRSAEDITYFAGDRGIGARPIRKFRYKNPLITSISSGDTTTTKRNDGLANIFGKIYNTMMKNREERKKLKEIESNFKEERLAEDERRHQELIDAIVKGRIPSAQPTEKKKSLLDDLLKMFDTLKDMFGKFSKWVVESLGKVGAKLGENLLKMLSSDLAPFLGIQAAVAAAQVYFVGKETEKAAEAAKIGDIAATTEAERRVGVFQMGVGAEFSDPIADAANAREAARSDLEAAAKKGSEPAKLALERMEKEDKRKKKAAEYVKSLGYDPNMDNLSFSEKPGFFGGSISRKEVEDAYKYADGKIGLPKKSKVNDVKPSSKSMPAAVAPASKASSVPPAPSPVAAASSENATLQMDEKGGGSSSSPVVVNNNQTATMPRKQRDGVPAVLASVRDEEVETPLISNLKRVAYQ
jgi:hypothetical protein